MTTKDDVLQAVENNHIWLNAMSLINPSDEMLRDIGKTAVSMLRQRDNLLPKYVEHDEATTDSLRETLDSMAQMTPTLYLRISAS